MRASTTAILMLLTFTATAATAVAAGQRCACRFEVATSPAGPRPMRRMTRVASDGACTFDVRLRVAPDAGSACDGAAVTMRRGGDAAAGDPWAMPWERVTVRARKRGVRRAVLRARVRGADGRIARTRLALRCASPIAGCDAITSEPLYCVLGGHELHPVASVDTGEVCGKTGDFNGSGPSLALWHGEVYTCSGSSPLGGFVATPLGRNDVRTVAGPCAATGTDGDALLVLPRAGFDGKPAATARTSLLMLPLLVTPPPHLRQIRAYDAPGDVPNGPYRVVADLDTIPEGSPCGALVLDTVTGHAGRIYASGCRPRLDGTCVAQPTICVFDAQTGAALPSLTLQELTGRVKGLSAIAGGRLVALSDDPSELPPIGYGDDGSGSGGGGADRLFVFDVTDGARLDTQTLSTSGHEGLACITQ
jgi:hypothetical protein